MSFAPPVQRDPGHPDPLAHLLPGLVRAVLALLAGSVGIVLWQALVRGTTSPRPSRLPVELLASATALTARWVLVALAIGIVLGAIAAALAGVPGLGRALAGVGWVLSMPWVALPAMALATVLLFAALGRG